MTLGVANFLSLFSQPKTFLTKHVAGQIWAVGCRVLAPDPVEWILGPLEPLQASVSSSVKQGHEWTCFEGLLFRFSETMYVNDLAPCQAQSRWVLAVCILFCMQWDHRITGF